MGDSPEWTRCRKLDKNERGLGKIQKHRESQRERERDEERREIEASEEGAEGRIEQPRRRKILEILSHGEEERQGIAKAYGRTRRTKRRGPKRRRFGPPLARSVRSLRPS